MFFTFTCGGYLPEKEAKIVQYNFSSDGISSELIKQNNDCQLYLSILLVQNKAYHDTVRSTLKSKQII
jgi:hypothetical protein